MTNKIKCPNCGHNFEVEKARACNALRMANVLQLQDTGTEDHA